MTRLILLDRDGVINYDSPAFIKDVDEWVPIPGALEAIAALKTSGYLVAVCTNQSGVGRGIVSEAALRRIHGRLAEALAEHGARLDGIRYCPHLAEDDCACRKPRPGMLTATMRELGVAAAETVYVGDRRRDLEAARAAGCKAVLLKEGAGSAAAGAGTAAPEAGVPRMDADEVADDLAGFVRRLLRSGRC